MGLRMATDRDFKIIRTLEKLNHIIHRSRLTTKFVSLFYGELETGGMLIYSNAGHNPPFLLKANARIEQLAKGGPVLGPTPDATYTRGFVKLDPVISFVFTPMASLKRMIVTTTSSVPTGCSACSNRIASGPRKKSDAKCSRAWSDGDEKGRMTGRW